MGTSPGAPQTAPAHTAAPRTAPPQQSRARLNGEIAKARAKSAVLRLIVSPGTDFAALDPDTFFAVLSRACQDGIISPALMADTGRRILAGRTVPRELHQVLFVGGTAWAQVREVVMPALVEQPHHAVTIIALEVQRRGTRPMRVVDQAGAGGFTVQVVLDVDGVITASQPYFDISKKRAVQLAAVSLLSVLVDIPVTIPGRCETTGGYRPPPDSVCEPAQARTLAAGKASAPDAVQAWLENALSHPGVEPDDRVHLSEDPPTVRTLYLLLFKADGPQWAPLRGEARDRLVATPARAAGVLSMHLQACGWPAAGFLEPEDGRVAAYVVTPDGPVVGEPAAAPDGRVARGLAAANLIFDLALPVDQAGTPLAPPAPRPPAVNPVGELNERSQRGVITDLAYQTQMAGPPHKPTFTCTATCTYEGNAYTGVAEHQVKKDAKATAAGDLLEQLARAEHARVGQAAVVHRGAEHAGRAAGSGRDGARTRDGIFDRLLRTGCPVDFVDREFHIGDGVLPKESSPATGENALPEKPAGPSPADSRLSPATAPTRSSAAGGAAQRQPRTAPMQRQTVDVLTALPILAAADGPLHPSARIWVTAARAALAAIADRRVYPAVDEQGRDCWKLLPHQQHGPAVAPFFDVVAEVMLRPAGAGLMIGDRPYAGQPRLLGPEAAAWADEVAEAVEGTTAVTLTIRLSPPERLREPLRAQLCPGRLSPISGMAESEASLVAAHHRLIRRGRRVWPPMAQVERMGTVNGADAAQLLGPVGDQLAELGITTQWPEVLLAGAGLGRHVTVRAATTTAAPGAFTLAGGANLAWQLTIDGAPLTDDEMTAAAHTVAGVAQLRGRWVVIDAETRKLALNRDAGHLSAPQALQAALGGQVTIDGRPITCLPAGQLAGLAATLHAPRTVSSAPSPAGLRATLRPYQRAAVQWLIRTTSAGFGTLLADDMGLGKTLTVIAFRLSRTPLGPSLVVCPTSLVINWEREFARFAPTVTVRRYHATSRSLDGLRPGDVVVTTYGTMLRDTSRLASVPWDLLVADEAQQIKNHRSQAAVGLRALPATARVAVTGTPIENSLTELWSILDWTNPGLFGPLAGFRKDYARPAEQETTDVGVEGHVTRRLGRLIAPFIMRRRKTDPDIAPDLPDKITDTRCVELTREQAALYQHVARESLATITAASGVQRRGQVLRMLQSLRQICNSPAHYLREPTDDWDPDRQSARSGKLQALDDLMDAVKSARDAALIFTSYVSMGRLIRAHLHTRGIPADFIHGATTPAKRQAIVDQFQSGNNHALVLSVRAAGTGLTLTRAGHVIHFDRPWNPAVEDQATDRAHRIGQHRMVEVHHLLTEGTVEDRIADLLASKRQLTEAVLDRGETALTELTDQELADLVTLTGTLTTATSA
jgi:superfamily II DNA or RNA helicase